MRRAEPALSPTKGRGHAPVGARFIAPTSVRSRDETRPRSRGFPASAPPQTRPQTLAPVIASQPPAARQSLCAREGSNERMRAASAARLTPNPPPAPSPLGLSRVEGRAGEREDHRFASCRACRGAPATRVLNPTSQARFQLASLGTSTICWCYRFLAVPCVSAFCVSLVSASPYAGPPVLCGARAYTSSPPLSATSTSQRITFFDRCGPTSS